MKHTTENASWLWQAIAGYALLCLLYRISLINVVWHLHSTVVPLHLASLCLGLVDDAVIGTIVGLGLFFLPNKPFPIKNSLFFISLMTFAVFYVIGRQIYCLLTLPVSSRLLSSAAQSGVTIFNCLPFLGVSDWILLSAPFILFLFFHFSKRSWLFCFLYYGIFPITALTLSCGLLPFAWYGLSPVIARSALLYDNPLKHLVLDFYRDSNKYYARRQDQASLWQKKSLAFIDKNFTDPTPPPIHSHSTALTPHEKTKWNIVLVVMESVGSEYAFTTRYSPTMAMPFLHQLAQKSLWLKNNYTSGNNSALGAFGLFSGIYPPPVPEHFILRPHINIPNMATWLGEDYDSFFVNLFDNHFYFPLGLLKNQKGIKHFYDPSNMPVKDKTLLYNMCLNDKDGLNFFLSHLMQAKPPFFAVYWPAATHFPYHDYQSEHYFLQPKNNLNRYLNNLRFLDMEIKAIFALLKNKHWLEHTIFIAVGDHGEGFGQHQGSYMHGTRLFEEQITVPAILYQPHLFKPQQVTQPTTSADILPTLLDTTHIPYSPDHVQGESLLRQPFKRKYVFVYGEEDSLAAIDKHHFKTYLSWDADHCVSYNLVSDPQEHRPLVCPPETESTLIQFRNYQPGLLQRLSYN